MKLSERTIQTLYGLLILAAFGVVGEMDYQDQKGLENIRLAEASAERKKQQDSKVLNDILIDLSGDELAATYER